MTDPGCPNCEAGKMQIFHEALHVPTNNCILLDSAEEGKGYPRGSIRLGFCPECGFIANTSFDEQLTEYSGRCEETQGCSATFNRYQEEQVRQLVERFDLHGKEILEIGCGKGQFLTLLCKEGGNQGLGFDPAFVADREESAGAENITFVKDFYSEKYTDRSADFVCCKMTLEHIYDTQQFMRMVRRAIGNREGTTVFFQIPEATRILKDCAYEDIYYEHCSYFTPCSLVRLFRDAGFEVEEIGTEYDDQYLTIIARPRPEGEPSQSKLTQPEVLQAQVDELAELVSSFQDRLEEKLGSWRDEILTTLKNGQRVVLWGSGSKGVAFLSTLGLDDKIEYAVDINPRRHGSHMPGSGLEIVAPHFLQEYRPDLVVIMNSVYVPEITRDLNDLGLDPKILAL